MSGTPRSARARPAILEPGRNCWRFARAGRLRFLVDGAAYFPLFRTVARRATRSVLIIGWDVDSRFDLLHEEPADGLPAHLGDFLEALVTARDQLQIHVLNWDYAMIFAPKREWLPVYRMDRTTHPRLHFRTDDHHPPGASQHQKIVVVDDRVAFVGGLDFALGRWDTSAHRPDDARRRDAGEATAPRPYHDLQLMVGGPVAGVLGGMARGRWTRATGEDLAPPATTAGHDPWPEGLEPHLTDVPVAIARTYPPYGEQPEVREVERLMLDAIAAARRTLYLENQYFTATSVGDALERRLAEEDGPEVVLILPRWTDGWLSRNTMDVLRERLLKRLMASDRRQRLRVYYPHVPGLGDQCVNVHTKLMVVDDRLLRVGSANYNNRSLGLDSECDLALEAGDDEAVATAIIRLRHRLLAEHLGVAEGAVDAAVAEHGGYLTAAVEALRGDGRTLVPFEFGVSPEEDAMVPDADIADPGTPMAADELARLVVDEDAEPAQRTLRTLTLMLAAALLLAAAWRYTALGQWLDVNAAVAVLEGLRQDWTMPLVVMGIYMVAALMMFPVTLLIIATGIVFGAGPGFVYALAGAEMSALVTFAIGRMVGHDAVRRLPGRWVAMVRRRLARQGLLAIITLRVVPVAPFSVVNLVAGASPMRVRDFAIGTLLGMAPGTLGLTVFFDQLVTAVTHPGSLRVAGLVALAALMGAASWLLNRWLRRRRRRRTGSDGAP